MTNRFRLTSSIAACPHEQAGSLWMELLGGQVIVVLRLVTQTAALDVLGDADDIRAWHRVGVDLHTLAERLFVGPNPFRHRLAHDHRARCLRHVLRSDAAATEDAGA